MRNEQATRIPVRRGASERPGEDRKHPEEPEAEYVETGQGPAGETSAGRVEVPPAPEVTPQPQAAEVDGVDWRDVALRLKAEMENFRKRQQRWAEDEVLRQQEQFLRPFLAVVDDLEQALKHIDPRDPAHKGVQVVYDGALSLLMRQGVERIAAEGQVFDPHYHEAVAVIPSSEAGVEDMHVIAVTAPGYMYAERVLRPAKVIVAKEGA